MYQLTAIFNKICLNDVLHDLSERKIEGITVIDVFGKGGIGFIEEGGTPDLYPKVKIEIILSNDEYKESAKEAIRANTQDLGHGAGKMWVTNILEVERIRTGEKNEAALTQSNINKNKSTNESYFTIIDTPAS
ncbi:MAG: P-II family nitrogen regulator [Campylobacterales bacterium]|nr:P-II family nitrogen regulator [Campylobacterales bacterium]